MVKKLIEEIAGTLFEKKLQKMNEKDIRFGLIAKT